MIYLLDTDHNSVLQRGGEGSVVLERRLHDGFASGRVRDRQAFCVILPLSAACAFFLASYR